LSTINRIGCYWTNILLVVIEVNHRQLTIPTPVFPSPLEDTPIPPVPPSPSTPLTTAIMIAVADLQGEGGNSANEETNSIRVSPFPLKAGGGEGEGVWGWG